MLRTIMKGNRRESQLSVKTARDFPSSPVIKASNEGGASSIPGQGLSFHMSCGQNQQQQNIKQKKYCSKFNEESKNFPHQKKILKGKKGKNNTCQVLSCSGPVSFSKIEHHTCHPNVDPHHGMGRTDSRPFPSKHTPCGSLHIS